MPNLMKDLAEGLAAFHADMFDHMQQLTTVTMSEFGRRASENGGKVHGEWPGLREGQLIGPGDLAVTTDYRDVLSEVLVKRLHNPATDMIFPNYESNLLGLMK